MIVNKKQKIYIELKDYLSKLDPSPSFDKQNKFIFFGNYKVGTKSINIGVLKHRVIRKIDIKEYTLLFNSLTEENLDSLFKFTIVRNPWDRVVSAFMYLQQKSKDYSVDNNIEFNKFIKEILCLYGTNYNKHFGVQYKNVYYNDKCIVDYIAKLETINNDWINISKKIDIKENVPIIGNSKRQLDYKKYYNQISIDIISELYKKDIELFNYKF